MTIRRTILAATVAALAGVGLFTNAADASDEEPLIADDVAPNLTDPAIDPARGNHFWWLPADPSRRNQKLLVFMPGGGQNNFPANWTRLGEQGGRIGYHTIVLAYRNEAPIAATAACGNAELPPASKPDCARKARQEILAGPGADGSDPSDVVAVSRTESIEYRLVKLLEHLARNRPLEGWERFLDRSGTEPAPNWREITVSGQSLGAGQAILIGMLQPVHRVGAFAGFTDARHGWITLAGAKTPAERFFALVHRRDNFYSRSCYAYKPPQEPDPLQPGLPPSGLGLVPACPLPGFDDRNDTANPLLVEHRSPPYDGAQVLVTNLEPATLTGVNDPYHTSTTRDGWTPVDSDDKPLLASAWRYVLGTDTDGDGVAHDADNCAAAANDKQENTDGDSLGDICDPDDDNDRVLDDSDNCVSVPNPDQSDTDGDELGDACDPTPGNTPGKVTGGGWIGEAKNSFGFTAQYSAGMQAPKGNVTYQDKTAGLELNSVELTSVIVYSATRAVILGTATVNGQDAKFRLEVEDHGEPGVNDRFWISWSGYEAGGLLNGGNIQIH